MKVVRCEKCNKKMSKLPKHIKKRRDGNICKECYLENIREKIRDKKEDKEADIDDIHTQAH